VQQGTPYSLSECNKALLPKPHTGAGLSAVSFVRSSQKDAAAIPHAGQALRQTIITTCSLSINQRDFDYTPRPDLLIFLTVYMTDINSVHYLVPSMVFTTPDNIFLVNEQPGALRHFSTWQIKIFTNAIETLSHYTLDAVNEL
jgi:hypothetical protein